MSKKEEAFTSFQGPLKPFARHNWPFSRQKRPLSRKLWPRYNYWAFVWGSIPTIRVGNNR